MEVFIMQVLSFAIMEDDKNMFDIFFVYAFFLAWGGSLELIQ